MQQGTHITSGTVARTLILAIALINQILSAAGRPVLAIADEDIQALVSTAFTVAASVIAWWKNNSFTAAARIGDQAMKEAKR